MVVQHHSIYKYVHIYFVPNSYGDVVLSSLTHFCFLYYIATTAKRAQIANMYIIVGHLVGPVLFCYTSCINNGCTSFWEFWSETVDLNTTINAT